MIHGEGLWGLLSKEAQDFGAKLYFSETGRELPVPPGAMKYSIEQHVATIDKILPVGVKATDFWKIVCSIVWISMAIERNPLLKLEIDNAQDPTALISEMVSRSTNG